MTRPTLPPLWLQVTWRLGLPAEGTSVDAVHKALGGVVGRGTVQRMREGAEGFGLSVMRRLADRLGCEVPDLLAEPAPSDSFSRRMAEVMSSGNPDRGTPLEHGGGPPSPPILAVTVAPLSRDELMQAEELPNKFETAFWDDALAPKAPRGTPATFVNVRQRAAQFGDAVLLLAMGEPHVRVLRQSLQYAWEATPTDPAYATFHAGMAGAQIVAVLESLGGGWAQLTR